MNLKIVQVVGLNTDQKAAQVTSSSRDGDNTLLAVLDLSSDDAFTRGRQLLTEISDFYFDFEGSPAEKLKAAYEQAKEKFAQDESSLLVASISGKILYFIAKGEVEIYLKRENKLSSLLTVGANEQLISGFLQPEDKLLFATKSLINFLAADLEKSLSLPLDSFEEEVTDRIGASHLENQSLAGLAVAVEEEQAESKAVAQETAIPILQKEESVSQDSNLKINLPAAAAKLIKNYFPKSGRGRLIIAIILILIISLGVGFKIKTSKDAQKLTYFKQTLQKAKDNFSAAKGLASLNPAEAKSKLDLAKNELNQALAMRPKDGEALNLKKQIDQDSNSILQQSQVSDFPLFLDTDLIKKNFRAAQMSLSAGKLLLLDPAAKTLVAIDLAKKSNQILAGSEKLGEAKFVSLNGELAFVYSEDKGVLRVDTANQKITTVDEKDEDLGKIRDVYGFGGNVYLLDLSGQIWKYLATTDGYSDKREYLTKNTKIDFSNALRMQIESSIYILKSGGEILRFTRGEKDNFGYQGLDKGVKDPKNFFVSSDTDNLYVLDSGNSRLLILTKTGSYKGQMSGSIFATASDLVADEKGKKVYLLDGSKIYTVDLK